MECQRLSAPSRAECVSRLCSGPCSVLKKQRCLKRLRVTEHRHDQNHSEILSVLSSCPHLRRCLVVSVSWGYCLGLISLLEGRLSPTLRVKAFWKCTMSDATLSY